LNKVASLQGIEILNVNQLANALKPVVLPGEIMRVFILREGKEYNQGVAYLDDGTMVVVDGARRMINKTVDITVTSVHQTTAGKMIFGRLDEREAQTSRPAPPHNLTDVPQPARWSTPAGTAKHSPQANECHARSSRIPLKTRNEARLFSIAGNLIALTILSSCAPEQVVLLNRESTPDKPETHAKSDGSISLQSLRFAGQIFGPYFKRRAA